MRAPHGYATWVSPDRPLVERDTASCAHCGAIILIKPGTGATVYLFPQLTGPDQEAPGAGCRLCMTPVCLACEALGRCLPLERHLEQSEARDRLRRAVLG